MEMLRDNSITVHTSHRVHRSGSFVSVRARKREDDEDGRTSRVKEEDTCVRAMAVEEEEEKGRRRAGGGGEEREKIGGGKDGLSPSLHTGAPESCDICATRKTTSLSTVS